MLARRSRVTRAYNLLGTRHFGAGTWKDINTPIDPRWPLHVKELHLITVPEVAVLAEGTSHQKDWELAERFLNDPTIYAPVPPVNFTDSRMDLVPADFQFCRQLDFYAPIDAGKVRGCVRAFTIGEPFKKPPRKRLIHWTYTVNQWRYTPDLSLCRTSDARRSVWDGPFAVSIDVKGCYNQIPYGVNVRPFFCFLVGFVWYSLVVLAMGQRQAVFIAHTLLCVVAWPVISPKLPYIDNLKMAGDRERLIQDVRIVRERSARINLEWNEDLSDPDSLVKPVVEFLGLVLDHENKRTKCVDKVITKLVVSWMNREKWTVRQFIAHCSILFYCTAAVGRALAPHEYVLQLWAATQGVLARGAVKMKQQFIMTDELFTPLEAWTTICITNEWVPVPNPSTAFAEPDFVMITDAAKLGWCSILIDMKGGQSTVVSGRWPPQFNEFSGISAESEPIALLAGIEHLFHSQAHATIAHYGDNSGNRAEVNKGYSTRRGHVVAGILAELYPNIKIVSSSHCPGADIPADEPSRGLPLDERKLRAFCQDRGIPLHGIRDLTARGAAPAENFGPMNATATNNTTSIVI